MSDDKPTVKIKPPEKRTRRTWGLKSQKQGAVLTQQLVDIAEGILLEGHTWQITSLCRQLRINETTFFRWRRENAVFRQVIEKAIERRDKMATERVENALLREALGYTIKERTYEPAEAADIKTGKVKKVLTKEVRKKVSGNVKAQQFWLRNREPERWPDRREITGNLTLEDRLLALAQRRQGDDAGDSGQD